MDAHHKSSAMGVHDTTHGTGYLLPCRHDERPKDNIPRRDVIFNEPLAHYCSLVLTHETVYYGLTLLSWGVKRTRILNIRP